MSKRVCERCGTLVRGQCDCKPYECCIEPWNPEFTTLWTQGDAEAAAEKFVRECDTNGLALKERVICLVRHDGITEKFAVEAEIVEVLYSAFPVNGEA